MKKIFVLLFLTACSTNYVKPINGSLNQFPEWAKVLERQPVVNGTSQPTYFDVVKVNRDYNTLTYKTDIDDEWSTPKEFVARGKGDCDEFAVAKYYALRERGFRPDEVAMVIIEKPLTQAIHIVTVVKLSGEEYVLDNEIPKPVNASEYFGKARVLVRLNELGVEAGKDVKLNGGK